MYYVKLRMIPSRKTLLLIFLVVYVGLLLAGVEPLTVFVPCLVVMLIWLVANRKRFARIREALKTPEGIVAYCDAEIQHSPKNAKLYNIRGVAHIRLHNFEQADRDFEKTIELAPGFVWAYSNQAFMLIKKGRYDEALSECQVAIDYARSPADSVYTCLLRSECYCMMGELDEALADIALVFQNEIKSKIPADLGAFLFPWLLRCRGKIRLMQGELEQAVEDFQSALKMEPDSKTAQAVLAVAHYRQGNTQEATTLWQSLIDDKADYGDIEWVRVEMIWPDALLDTAREIIAAL